MSRRVSHISFSTPFDDMAPHLVLKLVTYGGSLFTQSSCHCDRQPASSLPLSQSRQA